MIERVSVPLTGIAMLFSQTPPAWAQKEPALATQVQELEKQIQALQDRLDESETANLLREAQTEALAADTEAKPEERSFLMGSLALQKLNPEISISADFAGLLVINKDKFYATSTDRSSMPIRELGIHLQHVLDPYSLFKGSVAVVPGEGVELEEIYITWFGLADAFSLTVGRFRHNFGIVNRWHGHDLDQIDFPLAMRLVLGEEGLVGNGFAIKWLMPALFAHVNELTLEITDGENPLLFSGDYFTVPSAMAHLKNYYDVTESTYLEFGITGMIGFNNRRGYPESESSTRLLDEPWRKTILAGADLTLQWSPLREARYRSLTWRSEAYYANKEVHDATPDPAQHSWGLYSYLQYQLATQWFCGVRYDMAVPTIRSTDKSAWDIVGYLTFWQSEFVYLRLQYSHGQRIPYPTFTDPVARRVDNRILLQIDWAAGPHKHERY
jgi:hypothetical protein